MADAGRDTEFDRWLRERFAASGPFTIMVVLVGIGDTSVALLRNAHLHVVGDEITWGELVRMFESAKVAWDGAAFFTAAGDADPLLPDTVARAVLADLVSRLGDDRLVLNEGRFFDRQGRQLHVEEVAPTRH